MTRSLLILLHTESFLCKVLIKQVCICVSPWQGFELPVKQPARRTAYRKPSNKDQLASIKAARRHEEQERLKRLASLGPDKVPKKPPVMLVKLGLCYAMAPMLVLRCLLCPVTPCSSMNTLFLRVGSLVHSLGIGQARST